ncbi:MAG: outer membrane protein transport protein [Bacteroidota bacterium]
MRNITNRLIGIIVLSALVVGIMFAGGYQLNEQGARAVGMGGAFAATASDPSAIYFNPAGIAFQSGMNVLGGINFIIPSTTYSPASGSFMTSGSISTNSQVFTPFNIYGSYQISDQIVVGLGIYNPFGLGTQWPDLWGKTSIFSPFAGIYLGSYLSINASIATYYFNPTIAYKINDDLSVGLGVSYVYATVDMTRSIPLVMIGPPQYSQMLYSLNGNNELKGNGKGFNADLGIIYKPMDKLSFGLSYRTTTKIDFSGDATYTNMNVLAPSFPNGTGTATLPMPGNLYIGVAYMLSPDLRIEGDFQYVQWSSYDKLQINLPAPAGTVTYAKKWNDEPLLRVGVEYTLNENWTVRAGAIEDMTPQPASVTEPMLPDADRTDLTIGASYKITDKLFVDAAYMLVLFADKTAPANFPGATGTTPTVPGTYSSKANIISVNFGYSF